ncbi:HAD family hydrolase [Solimonas soli]|uniref:HAD family hydrolase n=1 Tax=Solimonas soli TaxID=413479 RepID=UPI00047FB22E|nr:HAD-IA family hydrolase [Solimonas soli]
MSILQMPRARPRVMLFDWHATLVDTMDAMYYALDDVLPRLGPLGLIDRLVPRGQSKTLEDAKLVKYVREHASLHPKLRAERKLSRTDIFEVLFGSDQEAKRIAHEAFDQSYAKHFGAVKPMEADARERLLELRALGIRIGVLSNRARRFMAHEIYTVDGEGWHELFDTMVCGDDVWRRKPHPDLVLKALADLGAPADLSCWYVGDSTTDIVAAKAADVTAVFYNGAGWDRHWIDRIFPGTVRHPHVPDGIVRDLGELVALARQLISVTTAA